MEAQVLSNGARSHLWVIWALFAAALAFLPAIPWLVPSRPQPWNAGQAAVAGFVLALLALTAAVSTFAGRETLRQQPGAAGRFVLLTIWGRCGLVGVFGSLLAYGAASPPAAWPFIAGGALLLLIHAPRAVARHA
jgi:hypothetical protein